MRHFSSGFFLALLCALSLGFSFPVQAADYVTDSDRDGFPDILEKGTGNDPTKNEALLRSQREGACGNIKTDPMQFGRPQNMLIILDISGSMSSNMKDGRSRIDVAKSIITRYIQSLPASMNLGVVIYGKSGCSANSVEILAPIGPVNAALKASLTEKIAGLRPSGQTPIEMTLKRCPEFFAGREKDNNHIMLVSDGAESCGGDPARAIRELKQSPINPEVTVIGLNVDSRTRRALEEIADSSSGTYADVETEEDFAKVFSEFFDKLMNYYKQVVCIVRQYNSYLTYETDQYNRSRNWILRQGITADDATKAELQALQTRLDTNHNERVEARTKLSTMIDNVMKEMTESIKAFTAR